MRRGSLMDPGRSSAPRQGSARTIGTTRVLAAGAGVAGVLLLAWTLWLAGQVSGLVVYLTWPPVGPRAMLGILLRLLLHPTSPAAAWPAPAQDHIAGPWIVYPVWLVLFLAHLGLLLSGGGQLRRHFGRRPGFATRRQVAGRLGAAAVTGRAEFLRPSLASEPQDDTATQARKRMLRADPLQIARPLGVDARDGRALYIPANLSALVEAAPQAGKTTRVIIPSIVDSPGPVLVTSTRLDVCAPTFAIREEAGPAWVFEPQGIVPGVERMRWSPIRGAEDRLVAIRRAVGFAAGAGLDSAENGDYFKGYAADIIQSLLHAAALDGALTMSDVYGWAMQRNTLPAETVLRHHGVHEWADALAKWRSSSSKDADVAAGVVRRSFACFADPRVLNACAVRVQEAFNVDSFLHERGALYLVGSRGAQATVSPLLSALIEDLVAEAQRRAFLAPGGRLDPWLSLLLDEPYNTAAPDSVPSLMSEGGGSGIAVTIVPQNRWQLLDKWGDRRGRALAAAANVQVFLGGQNDAERLRDLSTMAGHIDEISTVHSTQADSLNTSEQVQRHELLGAPDIRTLPDGRGLVFASNLPPVEIQIPAWWERHDADRLRQAAKQWAGRLARGER